MAQKMSGEFEFPKPSTVTVQVGRSDGKPTDTLATKKFKRESFDVDFLTDIIGLVREATGEKFFVRLDGVHIPVE